MILITGSVQLRPEMREEAFALGIEHSSRSRGEPGCLAHNCHADAEDSNRMVFIEEWTDMAAVKTHFAVPESGVFVRSLSAMAVAAPVMRVFGAEEVPGFGQDQRERQRLDLLRAEIQAGFDSGISEVDPFEQIAGIRQRLGKRSEHF